MDLPSGNFDFSVSHPEVDGGGCRLRVAGSITPASCSMLEQTLSSIATAPGIARIDLDLAAVTHLDPAALRPLLHLRRDLAERGVTLVFVNSSASMQEVLSGAEANAFFEVPPWPWTRTGEGGINGDPKQSQ